jgi:hypothetical protein
LEGKATRGSGNRCAPSFHFVMFPDRSWDAQQRLAAANLTDTATAHRPISVEWAGSSPLHPKKAQRLAAPDWPNSLRKTGFARNNQLKVVLVLFDDGNQRPRRGHRTELTAMWSRSRRSFFRQSELDHLPCINHECDRRLQLNPPITELVDNRPA